MIRTLDLSKVFEFMDIYNRTIHEPLRISRISLNFNLRLSFSHSQRVQVAEEIVDAIRFDQQVWDPLTTRIESPIIKLAVSGDIDEDQLVRIQQSTNTSPDYYNAFLVLTEDFVSKGKLLATGDGPIDLVKAYRYILLGGSDQGFNVISSMTGNPQHHVRWAYVQTPTDLFEQLSLIFVKQDLQEEALIASYETVIQAYLPRRSPNMWGWVDRQYSQDERKQLATRLVDQLTAQEFWEEAMDMANDLRVLYPDSVVFEEYPGIIKTRRWEANRKKKKLYEKEQSIVRAFNHLRSHSAFTEASFALNALDKCIQECTTATSS
jgi:hypothetical protein